ncbi:hypothetical protein K525DRAFT_270673 [Schizophyllum commune Loenen D]|nr:hypothetical protein K525DRAFT_270673 [Schizophyllum commune Loenen D]
MFDKAGIYTIVNRKAKALISSYGEQVKLSPALGPKENLCQLWFVKPSEGGSFVITNLSTGKSLDPLGGTLFSSLVSLFRGTSPNVVP